MGDKIINCFGSVLDSEYGFTSSIYKMAILKRLSREGYTVNYYQPVEQDLFLSALDGIQVKNYKNSKAALLKALDEMDSSEIFIYFSDNPQYIREILESDGFQKSNLWIFWDVKPEKTIAGDGLDKEWLNKFSLVISPGGGKAMQDHYSKLGVNEYYEVPFALDPAINYPVASDPILKSDLTYIENYREACQDDVKKYILNPAEKCRDFMFVIGGNGWEKISMPGNVHCVGEVRRDYYNHLYCSARVVLNLNCISHPNLDLIPDNTIFAAAGAGACVITDNHSGIEKFLEPGKEIIVVNDGEELVDVLDNLSDLEAYNIGCNARDKVIAEHTYEMRVKDLFRFLSHKVTSQVTA